MGRKGGVGIHRKYHGSNFDFGELYEFCDRLNKKLDKRAVQAINSEIVDEMAKVYLDRIKANTPVGTAPKVVEDDAIYEKDHNYGQLRENWKISDIKGKRIGKYGGNNYTVSVYNNTPYAKAVEEGHKQEVGRFVGRIQAQLVEPNVKGLEIIKKTNDECDEVLEQYVRHIAVSRLEDLFSGK